MNYSGATSGTYDVKIYDATGSIVKTATLPKSGSGDISNCSLSRGTYYVRVNDGTEWNVDTTMAFEKFVVQ